MNISGRIFVMLICLAMVPALAQEPRNGEVVFTVNGSQTATTHGHWGRLVDEWRVQMRNAGKDAGLAVSYQQGEPRPTGKPGILVAIQVRYFRFVAPAVRGFTGRWAGQAELDAGIRFLDLATGDLLLDKPAYAASHWSEGRFGDATNQQVRDLSVQIMGDVRILQSRPPAEAKAKTPAAVAPVSAAPGEARTSSADAVEISFWESVRNSRNRAELQAYLDRYPNGTFAVLARSRLAVLDVQPLVREPAPR